MGFSCYVISLTKMKKNRISFAEFVEPDFISRVEIRFSRPCLTSLVLMKANRNALVFGECIKAIRPPVYMKNSTSTDVFSISY